MKFRGILSASLLSLTVALASSVPANAQSLSQALAAAYDHAPDLQSALIDAKVAAEGIVGAKAGRLPTIGASVGGSYDIALGNSTWTNNSSLNAGLRYNQTIYDSNLTESQIELARAQAEVAEHTLRNAEQRVLFEVVQAYMAVLGGRELVALRQENLTFFQAQLKSAEDRLEVGEGTRIDVAQAQARLASGQAMYQAARSQLEADEASFQRLVGMRPQNLSTSHNYANLIPRSLDAAISEAEIGHPGILLAKAGIRAAQAGSDAAESGFGPTATITGTAGGQWSQGNRNAALAVTSSGGLSASLGFNISVPIYAGGKIGSAVRQANLRQIGAEVSAMGAYDQIRAAVIAAWTGIQSADAQIQAAQAGVASSRTVLDGVIQERDLGTRTTLEVLNAQADLTSAREAQINAGNGKIVATFALLNAMGRLTAQDLGLPVAVKTAVPYTQAVEDVWQELRTVPQ
ncbi:MAG: TolC family outer membrane protein [Phyllobacteriaceae bacterium]|nr:TolC family outer membrane protein [Phyllobacteriaceae bacterium]